MTSFIPHPRIKRVQSFHELISTPFGGEVNALCWSRTLPGDFAEVVEKLALSEGITVLDESMLRELDLTEQGKIAIEVMIADLQLLRDHDLDPVLNCINAYPRDEAEGPVATDVLSWHVDSANTEADTWLCTYHGACSEGLPNDEAVRRVDIPATRAELLKLYGGKEDEGFVEYLHENCYDLHYLPTPNATPYHFGIGTLWRIAVEYPGSPVLPCIHRAPETLPGEPGRLLLIS